MNVPCEKQLLRKGQPRALSDIQCTASDEVWNATSLGTNKARIEVLNKVLQEATERTVYKDSLEYITSDFSEHIDQINNIEDTTRKKKHLREKLLCEVSVLRKELDKRASSKEGTMDFLMRRHSLQRQSSTGSSISSKEYPQELSTSCKERNSLHDTKNRRHNSLGSGNKRFLVINSNSAKLCPSVVQEPNTTVEFEKEEYITRNNDASDTHQSFDVTAKQIALVSIEEKIYELEEELAEHFKI